MTERQQQYRKYLASEHWKNLRTDRIRQSKKRCAICGDKQTLQCHHIIYRRWYDVTCDDLRILCDRCHGIVHKVMSRERIKIDKNNPARSWTLVQRIARKELRQMPDFIDHHRLRRLSRLTNRRLKPICPSDPF